jgi:hypothetical protein
VYEEHDMVMLPIHREPVWSAFLTEPMARHVPTERRREALAAIKAAHTAVFFSVLSMIVLLAWDGLRGRPRRRTAIALGIAVTETAIYASNNQVCPLSPLAESLGASRGSVSDIFLPEPLSRRIPILAGSLLAVGIALNLRVVLGRSGPWTHSTNGTAEETTRDHP